MDNSPPLLKQTPKVRGNFLSDSMGLAPQPPQSEEISKSPYASQPSYSPATSLSHANSSHQLAPGSYKETGSPATPAKMLHEIADSGESHANHEEFVEQRRIFAKSPVNMEVVWYAVNVQGKLLTDIFSTVYDVVARDVEWVALAFTDQLSITDQSLVAPLTLKQAERMILELELAPMLTRRKCRQLLRNLRDASYKRMGISFGYRGWSPKGKAAAKWVNVTSSKMLQSQKSLLATEFQSNSNIDFREVFMESLFSIALMETQADPESVLMAFFDVYHLRYNHRTYILQLLQYNKEHSPHKNHKNNTLQYLRTSSGACLGRFSSEYFAKTPSI